MREQRDCNSKIVNVYSYARWSSPAQRTGDSKRRQEEAALKWCEQHDMTLTDTEIDDGVSAKTGRNCASGSGLDRLLKQVKPGDYVLVEDNDRLSRRDWLTSINYLAKVVDKGAKVVTLMNGNTIDAKRLREDPGCFLQAIMRSFLAHDEDVKKGTRIAASWAARKTMLGKGKAIGTHLPCWLRWVKHDGEKYGGHAELVKSNERVIRKMFALALEGLGCQTIARRLHKEGDKLVTEHGRVLTISAPYVWRVLRNKLCIGYGVYTEPPKPGVYPAVVTEEVFFAVQKLLKHNQHQTVARASSTSSLFTGIARCSRCGGTLCRFSQRRNGKRYEYLVCSDTLHKHGKCGMASIRYDAFEKSFLQLLAQSDLMRQAMSAGKPAEPSPLDSLNGQLADAENMAIKLLNLVRKDPDPPTTLLQAIKDEEAKAADLRQRIEDERGRLKAETPGLEEYQEFCERFGGRLERKEYRAEVKALLRSFVLSVEVKLGQNQYAVMLKGASMPITVTIAKGVWTFYPIPAWALGRELLPNDIEAPLQGGAAGVLGVV